MSIPLASALCGEQNAGPTVILVALLPPIYNVLAVVIFSIYNDKARKSVKPLSLIIDMFKNPIIVSSGLGLIASLFSIKLPQVIESPIFTLSAAGSTLAIIGIGAQLDFKNALNNLKLTAVSVFTKLALLPAASVSAAIAAGFSGPMLCAVFVTMAMPCATGCATTADVMDADGALAAEIVAATTVVSMFTVFIGSVVLRASGLI